MRQVAKGVCPRLVLSASNVRFAVGAHPLTQTLLLGDLWSISLVSRRSGLQRQKPYCVLVDFLVWQVLVTAVPLARISQTSMESVLKCDLNAFLIASAIIIHGDSDTVLENVRSWCSSTTDSL